MRWIFFLLFVPTGAMSQSIKVMTYNIRFDNPEDGENRWSLRKEKVVSLLKKYDPDIIGVQEALHHQLNDLLEALPAYARAGVGRDDGKQSGEYSAILYKKEIFTLRLETTQWLSEEPDAPPGTKGWDAALPRIFTLAQLRWIPQEKDLIFVNTHFDHVGEVARERSPFLISGFVTGFRFAAARNSAKPDSKVPVVLMGDLNSEITEPGYRNFLTPSPSSSFADCRPESDTRGTYCTFQTGKPCRLIDYIFRSNEWRTLNYQVVSDNDGTHYPSDHLPVLVTLELAPN